MELGPARLVCRVFVALILGAVSGALLACGPFSSAALYGLPLKGSPYSPGAAPPPPAGPQWVTYARPVSLPLSRPPVQAAPKPPKTVRYRLRLRDNAVDPDAARRCYSGCRLEKTQGDLLACLAECPGFEVTTGAVCGSTEGPPRSVCITHRVEPREGGSEADPGLVLIAVLADFALYIGLSSVCGVTDPGCITY